MNPSIPSPSSVSTPSPKDAPAFDFYPERWCHGTRHMTKAERCDFLDLLAIQWTDDGIADDLPRIARVLGYRLPKQIPPVVLEKFPVAADGRRRHPFLEKLRAEQRTRIQKSCERAQRMNAVRWNRPSAAHPPMDQGHEEDAQTTAPAPASAAAVPHVQDSLRTPQGVLDVSPPPTTHHPPRRNILKSGGSLSAQAREGRGATVEGSAPSPPQTRQPSPGQTPHAFPTLPEVQNHGQTIGADPACCEAFWQDCEAVHWVNKHGIPIADWRPLLARFRTRWAAVAAQQQQRAAHASSPASSNSNSNSNSKRNIHYHANPPSRPPRITGELNQPGRYASAAPSSRDQPGAAPHADPPDGGGSSVEL